MKELLGSKRLVTCQKRKLPQNAKVPKPTMGGAPEGQGSGFSLAGCVRFSLYTFAFQRGQDSFHELLLLSCVLTPTAGLKFSEAEEQVCRTQGAQ